MTCPPVHHKSTVGAILLCFAEPPTRPPCHCWVLAPSPGPWIWSLSARSFDLLCAHGMWFASSSWGALSMVKQCVRWSRAIFWLFPFLLGLACELPGGRLKDESLVCQFRVRASIPICSSMTESNNGFAGFPIEIAPGLLWTLNSQIAILCWQQRDVPFLWCMENCVLHIVQSPVRLSSSYPGANGSFFHFRGTSTAICLSLSFNDYVELLGGV